MPYQLGSARSAANESLLCPGEQSVQPEQGSTRSAENGNLPCPVEQSVQPEQGSTRIGPALV